MTTRAPAARVFRAAFFLAFAALTSACQTGGDGQSESSSKVEVSTEAKAGLAATKAARPDSAEARVEARGVPGQAQLDVAAAQLAEANARLNDVAHAGASVEANAQPRSPSLKASKSSALVDAKVQPGNPSLNIGKAGTLIDANVQAGRPSLNIGALKPKANTSASAGTPANTPKAGASAEAKGKVNFGIGQ